MARSAFSRHFGFSQRVTSLVDKIYVAKMTEILVYENEYPYRSLTSIVFGPADFPLYIVSCNINKCLYVSFLSNDHIFKIEPLLDNRMSKWLHNSGLFILSITSRGDVLFLKFGSENNELRIITHKGTVKRTISMDYRFNQTQFIQEIMPDIVALNYDQLPTPTLSCIAIMRLDENGTLLRNIECDEAIGGLSSFRYGDLFIGVLKHKNVLGTLEVRNNDNPCVKLQHWALESKVPRDLLTTDDKIVFARFDADQKRLYMLSSYKLDIYHLYYEDEVYNS